MGLFSLGFCYALAKENWAAPFIALGSYVKECTCVWRGEIERALTSRETTFPISVLLTLCSEIS